MAKKIIILILSIVLALTCIGQDLHFSQFYSNPLFLNPAYTGNHDCLTKCGINYRNQWSGFTKPYVTESVFLENKIVPKSFKNDWLGIGGLFYNDKAGDGNLKNTRGEILAAYHMGLAKNNTFFVSLGAGLSIVNRSVNFSKLIFDSQWTNNGFDPSAPNNESLSNTSLVYFDLNAGILVSYSPSENMGAYIGISLDHIGSPKETFYVDIDYHLGTKATYHAGADYKIGEKLYIQPKLLYSRQKKASEFTWGSNVALVLGESKIYLGAWNRLGYDLIALAGFEYQKFAVLISYDINYSKVRILSNSNGGFEISLIKILNCGKKRNMPTGYRSVPMF